MYRREFLGLTTAAIAAAQQQKPANESVTATATQDATPRVGVVLSSFAGATEHDETKLKGLADPRPKDADLTDAQFDAMVRRAIELGDTRTGGLHTVVGPEDWVVIKTDISSCHGLGEYVPGSVTDLRMIRTLINWMVEHKCGGRITVAEGSGGWQPVERSKASTDGWTTTWGGAFGGLSYKAMIEEFAKKYPSVRFELADLNFEDTVEMPVQGAAAATNNKDGMYWLPKSIQQCDKLISVSPLKIYPKIGASLAMGNYLGIAPGAKYGFPKSGLDKLGDLNDVLIDLYSFHPADYAMAGGCLGVEGHPHSTVHHNLVIAGLSAVAVDTVAGAAMGFEPAELKYLALAEKKGFGGWDMVDLIWTRGNDVEESKRKFRRA